MTITKNTALALVIAAVWVAPTQAEETLKIDIEAQALETAFEELGLQTGLVVSAPTSVVSSLQSAEVTGQMTPRDALQQMLSGTGLVMRFVEADSAVVSQNATGSPFDLGTLLLDSISGSFGAGGIEDDFETESSVTTLTREDIEESPGQQSVENLLAGQPNINTLGKSNGFVQIRGEDSEGAGNAGFAIIPGALSATPVTIDGRPISFAELTFGSTSVYDTEFVEIVRGPSTTRGGINGSIGAVNVVSASPTFEREGELVAEGSSFDGKKFSGFFNTPLSNDVALRFTFDRSERDTYVESPPEAVVIDEARRLEQTAARLSMLWTPSEIPDLKFRLQLNYAEFSGPQTEIVNRPVEDLVRTTNLFPAAFSSQALSLTNSIEYDLGNGNVLSNRFTYSENETQRRSGDGAFSLDEDGTDLTNELRLDFATADGRLTGLAGVFYRQQTNDVDWDFFGPTEIEGERNSLGVYTDVTYEVTDQFEVFGGIRYQREEQDREGLQGQTGNPTKSEFERTDDAFLPRLGFAYEPNENTRIGFVASRGFAPGGFSFSFPPGAFNDGSTPLDLPEFEDETRTTYEIFARTTLMDGRLDLSGNIFYNDIRDIQIVSLIENPARPGNLIGVITNGDRARSYGLEVAANFQASDRFRLYGSLGLLESEFTEFDLSPEIVGNQLQEAPDTTITIGFDYDVTPDLKIGANVNHISGYFSNFANDSDFEVPSRTIANFNASYTPSENVELYAYVNNVFDERSPTFLFGSGAAAAGGVTTPRQIGFGLRTRF